MPLLPERRLRLFAREYFDRFAPLYLETRPRVADRLVNPYYAGQIALALSAARIPLPSVALPLRFNFPNLPVAAERYPEELENAVVFHYLREDQFDRQKIFRWRETYSVFLARPLQPRERALPRFGAHALRGGVPVRPPTRAA